MYTVVVTDQLISQLVDFGALGLFSGFLVYQFVQMQKRLDTLVESFQSQVREINDDFDDRVEKMRARYDQVISQIRQDCSDEKTMLREEARLAQRELLARERESVLNLKMETKES